MRISIQMAAEAKPAGPEGGAVALAGGRQMAQPEGNIGGDGKMREQRMVLEDHADMAPLGGDVDAGAGDGPAADADLAALQVFQAGGAAQGGDPKSVG